jgi:hypothetical protein
VEQGTPWRFDDSHALPNVILVGVQDVRAENVRIIQQDADTFDGKQGLDQAGVVEVKCVLDRFAIVEGLEGFEFLVLSMTKKCKITTMKI